MIGLIGNLVQLVLTILYEIFKEYNSATQEKRAVDASNAKFQLIVNKALMKIGMGGTTKPEDDEVDKELNGKL